METYRNAGHMEVFEDGGKMEIEGCRKINRRPNLFSSTRTEI
jgi:hypothetical protein